MVPGFRSSATAACLLLAGFAAAQCSTTTAATSSPTKPAADPFWDSPSDLSSRAQGSVFNCRAVNWNAVDGAKSYYQYAYKTVLLDGTSVVAVATLLIPSNNATAGIKYDRLLSYQIPYDSPTSFCGPSFVNQPFSGMATGNTYGVSSGAFDQAPSQALKAGIPVVISDYETRPAVFTAGISEGYGTINGIRAVLKQSGFFASSPKVVLWGYSGGALATEFALELAGSQATDLNIVGAALGGLTPITRNTAILVTGVFRALVPYSLLGLANQNSSFSSWLQSNLSPNVESGKTSSYKARFNAAASDGCNTETAADFSNSNFDNWFTSTPASGHWYDLKPISDALNVYGIMGQTGSNSRTTPKFPLYFYKGTADEVSAIADTDALYNKYCASGAGGRITYVKYNGKNHGDTQTNGSAAAWTYLSNRLLGQAAPSGCLTNTVG